MDIVLFVTFWVQWSLSLGHLSQKLLSLAVTRHFMATHHHYVSVWDVDKKLSRMVGNSTSPLL